MPAIDFRPALGNPTSIDHANIEIQGMRVSRTIKMGLFTINENAVAQGDYLLSKESYPVARVKITTNRNSFKLQPGDPFVFKFPKYGISEMVCRVVFIEEEEVESEKIIVTAIEESVHATTPITIYTEPADYRKRMPTGNINVLTPITIMELPYALSGERMGIVPLVPKKTGNETGYHIYMSLDGTEYYKLRSNSMYNVWGWTEENYPKTDTIDYDNGLLINFDSHQNTDLMQSISYTELLGTRNTALLGDELITFQDIVPVTATQYLLTGVYRGRWGTSNKAHSAGENFYFVGPSFSVLEHNSFTPGSTRYFKFVPYSAQQVGSLSSALEITHTFEGESYKPYEVINLEVNGDSFRPYYDGLPTPSDLVVTWTGRVRGEGTGIGDPNIVVDSAHTYEGLFRVKFYVDDTLIKTVDNLDAETYTYTSADLLTDMGSYPSYITVGVSNFLIGTNNVEYESDEETVLVRKSGLLTTTTTSTTTTSSTTTTTV